MYNLQAVLTVVNDQTVVDTVRALERRIGASWVDSADPRCVTLSQAEDEITRRVAALGMLDHKSPKIG